MIVADVFLILIFATLLVFGFLGFLAWQKISVFLTYNTRYSTNEYEQSMTRPKHLKPSLPPVRTVKDGRQITQVPDLIDLQDVEFETAFKAVEDIGRL